jgi:guanylate kinase
MVANNGFVEWANVHSRRYGTAKRSLEERIQSGTDVLLEIDYQGALQVKQAFPNAVLIFILPPSWDELRARLENRARTLPKSSRCA